MDTSASSSASAATAGGPVEQFKPSGGFVIGWISLVVAAAVVVYVLVEDRSVVGLRVAIGAVFVGALVWVTQLRPRAAAHARTLELRNAVRDVHLPLRGITDVAVRQTLNVWMGDERFVCIGIGRTVRQSMPRRSRRNIIFGTGQMADYAADESPGGESGPAGLSDRGMNYESYVETRIEELARAARRDDRGPDLEVRRTWAVPEVAVLAVSGLALVASFVLL